MNRDYDEHEWITMLFAPLWVFECVAGVDGEVDDREWEALFQAMQSARRYRNDLSRLVFSELAHDFDELLEEFELDEAEIGDGLSEVASLLYEREDEDVAVGFKVDLIALAVEVAKASGGWLNYRISDEEKRAIGYISAALDMEEDSFYAVLEDLEAL